VSTVTVVTGESTTERLHAALDGDAEAWRALVDEFTNLLWWIARSYRLDDATSADVVQTVWLQLVQHGRSITDPERLPAWLSTTARRESARRASMTKRAIPVETMEDVSDRTAVTPEERVIDEETISIALVAFRELGDECRRLLGLLCHVPPKSYEEIAALIGKSTGHIGPTRQRCLARLRATMRGMGTQ
jgi:RNA polymerase sigma factor (sigma-70 family)